MSLKEKMNTTLQDIKKTSHDLSEASKEMFQDVKTHWEGSKAQGYWNKGLGELKTQYTKLREKSEDKAKTPTKTENMQAKTGNLETKTTPKPPSDTEKQ